MPHIQHTQYIRTYAKQVKKGRLPTNAHCAAFVCLLLKLLLPIIFSPPFLLLLHIFFLLNILLLL